MCDHFRPTVPDPNIEVEETLRRLTLVNQTPLSKPNLISRSRSASEASPLQSETTPDSEERKTNTDMESLFGAGVNGNASLYKEYHNSNDEHSTNNGETDQINDLPQKFHSTESSAVSKSTVSRTIALKCQPHVTSEENHQNGDIRATESDLDRIRDSKKKMPKSISLNDDEIAADMASHYREIIEQIGEDPTRQGLLKTPERAAKALMFFTKGYKENIAGWCTLTNTLLYRHAILTVTSFKTNI
ncbi:hypothetical protein EGW08_021475 [Elysia chlorotica]|uniref:GTP cyclohydrolase 1 n=1 Tax=Elysia chlorotica TaxID=188477 RepID=A0A433SNI5_ELYCH|nr:hypothetical protein EGW08_021475 [Elysia chlorotica]